MRWISILVLLALPVDAGGLEGKVLCGYQGWFRVPADGIGCGWTHYGTRQRFEPGHCTIDLWPDVRELPAAKRYATDFKHADGSVAEVCSPVDRETVDLHFRWMRDYGIDGVFVQRFVTTTRDPRFRGAMDRVLSNCRDSAREYGRDWALMYDLSGLKPGESRRLVEDWKHLRSTGLLDTAEPYLRHGSKPLVALWGLGFRDRRTTLDEWHRLVDFLHDEGCSVMLGVPSFWRTRGRDCLDDPDLGKIFAKADILSPWKVGRYRTPEEAARHARDTVAPDLDWCRERKIDYLPVVFPGFSWHNLKKTRGEAAPVNAIPRRGGRFLWSQARHFHAAGATALYVAMFDEIDEGTAIFKVRPDPPVGASPFVAEPDLPSDHYLWLTGRIGALLRGDLPDPGGTLPRREDLSAPSDRPD